MSDPSAVPPPPPPSAGFPTPPASAPGGFAPPPAPGGGFVPSAGPALQLSSAGKRLGAALLDGLLFVVTLGIGWLIWWVISWGKATSPAKGLLGMRIVRLNENRPLTMGEMAMRELVGKWLLNFIPFYGLVGAIFVLVDENRQALWDKVAGSTVVDDPNNVFGL
jgi:uncharacterized RDD family membrane protein YckC